MRRLVGLVVSPAAAAIMCEIKTIELPHHVDDHPGQEAAAVVAPAPAQIRDSIKYKAIHVKIEVAADRPGKCPSRRPSKDCSLTPIRSSIYG